MTVSYKLRCIRCKKNYVVVNRRQKYVVCYECEKEQMSKPVTDPNMKKMFDIPEEFYKKNDFLRSIKLNYIRFGSLSERQIEAFKETVKKMKGQK